MFHFLRQEPELMGCYKFLTTGKLMLSLSLLDTDMEQYWKRKVSVVSFGSHASMASGTMAWGRPNLEITKSS